VIVVGVWNRVGNGARRMARLKARGPGGSGEAHLLVEVGSTVAAVVLVAEATRGHRR
jgi:hypothetical protein